MLPRRRNIGGVSLSTSDETPLLENEINSYSKFDKKGSKYYQPETQGLAVPLIPTKQGVGFEESDIVFDFLEEPVFEVVMAARDRTNEFASTVRSLQGRTLARPIVRDERKAAVLETYSQFMSMAKVISKNITGTYAKLEKLALCK